jgi:hypothetical protein
MTEREPFSEVAAEYILGVESSPLSSERFGEGARFITPSGRNLDVFDGRAIGINGRGANLIFDASDLSPVYAADSVGFEGMLNGRPFAVSFHGETGDVIFLHGVPGGEITSVETSSQQSDGTGNGTAAEQAPQPERGELVSFTGNLGRKPQVFTVNEKPRVKLAVAEHYTGDGGEDKTRWHEVWTVDTIGPRVAEMVIGGILTQGKEVQIKGYEHRHKPKQGQTEGKPFIRAVVVNPVRQRPQK